LLGKTWDVTCFANQQNGIIIGGASQLTVSIMVH